MLEIFIFLVKIESPHVLLRYMGSYIYFNESGKEIFPYYGQLHR